MRTLRNGRLDLPESVIAIGAFDGVHKGHQEVIKTAVEKAKSSKAASVVYTFDPPPRNFFQGVQILTTIEEKVERIERMGVDYVIVARFNEWFSNRRPNEFIHELKRLHPNEIMIGADFRFGKNREGNVALLKKYFPIHVTAPVCCKSGELISSTRIRQLLSEGDFQTSYALLGW
ncbi:FAD synthetase [Neobacillus drentensis]|uniref:FAD synthetase n=1 Tax=Neobacillus drentensis TaxID=220684 RepID=UPI00300046A6